MTKYEQAIKYFEEYSKVLDDHCKRGGEFAAEALEHTKTAIEALKKQSEKEIKMKFTKRIKNYIIEKLGGVPYECAFPENAVLRIQRPDIVKCAAVQTVKNDLLKENGFMGFMKRELARELADGLLKNELITISVLEDKYPELDETVIRAEIEVVVPQSE